MTSNITPSPELVDFWVDLLEARSDQTVFTLAARWGYTQAVKELEEFLKKTVDTPCNNPMTTRHPITPSQELAEQWVDASLRIYRENGTYAQHEFELTTQAARWGADQELEACCEWLRSADYPEPAIATLRACRRAEPKPPSLKDQALADLHEIYIEQPFPVGDSRFNCIRRALEQLND
jgi:hypothetical protein